MLFKRSPENDDVVKVCKARVLKHAAKDDSYHANKRSGSRRQSKMHDVILNKSEWCAKRVYLVVVWVQFEWMIPHRQVK